MWSLLSYKAVAFFAFFAHYSFFSIAEGNWQVPHSLALFEETDVLCVADREGGRVECINAGIQKPLHANRDDTGRRVVNYNQKVIGRPYAIASKGYFTFICFEAKY